MYVGSSQDFSEINWKKVIPRVPSFLRKPREPEASMWLAAAAS